MIFLYLFLLIHLSDSRPLGAKVILFPQLHLIVMLEIANDMHF